MSGCRLVIADWSSAKCENHDSSFGCSVFELRTEMNKFGSDTGAECEMLVKSLDELSERRFEIRNLLMSWRAYNCLHSIAGSG